MRVKRILFFMVVVLLCAPLWGQDDFNPTDPPEPGAPPTKLVINVVPEEGGSVSGEGRHVPGTTVNVHAYSSSNFVFSHWSDAEGNTVSTEPDYSIVKQNDTETLTAHFTYSPGSPAEPLPGNIYYRLKVDAGEGGSASGGGKYQAGAEVTLNASCNTNFKFAGWTDSNGETVSDAASFTYIKKEGMETLTAHFEYDPDSPSEPTLPVLSHKVYMEATEGGTVSDGVKRVKEGSSTTVSASCNSGYKFIGWYLDGELYTTLSSFSYTMGTADVHFEARFEFDPDSPAEPQQPDDKKYALYFMTEITYPGTTIDCPLLFTSLDEVRDMTFNMTFPQGVVPLMETVKTGDDLKDYTLSVAETGEENVYCVSLIGGQLPAGSHQVLSLQLSVPEDMPLNQTYQVKLNQVSLTQADMTTVTASTRNGRVQIFALGDTNGDGEVNITDRVNIVKVLLNGMPEDNSFIEEVSDVSGDGDFSITDGVGVNEIILKQKQ